MAGALVGGAFLSAFLQVAFDRVASREVLDFLKGRKDICGLLRKLKIKLLSANVVLNDAEEKQITDPAVKEWLDELQDAVYDADELLDEIAYEGLRCKIEADSQSQTGTSLVQNPIPSSVSSSEFEKILENLEFIIEQMGVLGLKEVSGGVPVPSPRISTSCQEKCGVFGREMDKEAIFRLLQSNEASSDEICVVPIVGMGGIGKTTLAQFVYNDSRVDQSFDLKAWVCVSVNFNSFEIFKTIYEEVTLSPCKFKNLTTLQTEIRKALKGKKFFLVLDDVWNENYNKWDDLLQVFKCDAQEVKIIVTTRSERAASIVQTIPTHHCVKELSDDMCWDLFVKHAFGNGKSYADFEVIGKQIVKKCGGLPLAIKTVGGSLRSNKNPTHWKMILKNHIWDLPEAKTNILPALRLSYHYLPSHLKRCFAYCSIFPKGYEFNKEELILLWMAEGLLEQPKEDTSMDSMEFEEIGEEYFNDLVSRSFFQQSNKSESCFVMHDLIHDLAKSISGKVCFSSLDDESNVIAKKARYFLYCGAYYHDFKKFEICYEAKGLRTFLVKTCSSTWFNDYYKIEKMMDDLLETFKCLRVLSWSKHVYTREIRELPVSIGNLQHLRYLNIYGTGITHLPDSLCRLYNLQTLILSSQITNLPTNMGKLINLRHLDNSQSLMKEMPPQMGKLKKLRKLPVFVVGKHGGSSIRELGELHHLSGKLSVLNLENFHCTIDDPEIPKVMLKDKQDITELVLEWDFLRYIEDSIKEKSLLEQLCPHTNLNSLTIKYYGGTSFPNWLGDSSFLNMVSLKLDSCMYCFALPPLGQLPTLKKLEIYGLVRVVAVGREFYGNGYSTIKPFRSLEYLSFAYMLEWKEWVTFEDEVFSRLQELHISGSPKLSVLPNCLPSLTKLEIRRCEQLVSLPRAPVLHEIELLWNWKIQFASGHYYPSLECMTIRGVCDSMSLEFFPKLKYIIIYDCENFEYLTSLEIKNCPNFISFPSKGLRAPKLTKMKVESCNKLQSLPEGMHTLLPSLITLELLDCPELESFPEGGLPSNLVKLEISSCNKLISCRMEWGLQSLHSLKEFSIAHKYEEVDSFPEEMLLPPSLTYFSILDFSNMKSLNGKGFQHLASLKTLSIERCHKLECLPEEGLPTSLSQLHILGCPLLKQRCEKEKGEDWLKIAHIPNIVMSYESLNTSAQVLILL